MNNIRSHALPWLRYLWQRFNDDRCTRSAAALTYMSLFALVPLMTVMYAMLSAIPAFQGVGEQVQEFLFENLMPSSGKEVEAYLSDFSRQARNLTGIGIGFLVVTAVLLLRNIESTLNSIWRTRENRSPLASFLLYWAVLSLGPLFIGLALGISTYMVSVSVFFEEYDVIGIGGILLKLAPVILVAAAFSLIYAAVPNCRVPIKHALIGGVVTSIIFNLARALFTKAVMGSSYTVIYGAFAAFPLFLLWLYLSWNIMLAGGILVHSLSAYHHEAANRKPLLLKALGVLHLLWLRQDTGESARESDILDPKNADTHGLDSDTWCQLRDLFLQHKLLQIDESGHYLLARDLHKLSYWQLKEWVNGEMSVEEINAGDDDDGWKFSALNILRDQRLQQQEQMQISLAELFSS
jgi:membrane protein